MENREIKKNTDTIFTIKAKAKPYRWVQHADELYVAARFLFWKGFPFVFALLGAHVIELYLKAYLIYKVGRYPKTHDLNKIYKECLKYDKFFSKEFISRHFLPLKPPFPDIQATWTCYSDIFRYPESLPNVKRPNGAGIIIGYDGTIQTLDCIAHFVKQAIPRLEGERDFIDELINGDRYLWSIHTHDKAKEIREVFLRDNAHFTTKDR